MGVWGGCCCLPVRLFCGGEVSFFQVRQICTVLNLNLNDLR